MAGLTPAQNLKGDNMKKMFKNLNLSSKTILFLIANGLHEEKFKSNKYRMMRSQNLFYFVGKNGSIRMNTKPLITGSQSVTDRIKTRVLKWAEHEDQKEFIDVP